MLRAILGLIKPSDGAISVLGKPPTRGNAAIGYMPQARGPCLTWGSAVWTLC